MAVCQTLSPTPKKGKGRQRETKGRIGVIPVKVTYMDQIWFLVQFNNSNFPLSSRLILRVGSSPAYEVVLKRG